MSAPDYTQSERDFHQLAFTEARLRITNPTTNEFPLTAQAQPLATVQLNAVGVSPYMNKGMINPDTLIQNINSRYQI
jgi:hypothetical protein